MKAEMEKLVQEKEKAAKVASTTMEALSLTTLPLATLAIVSTGTGSSTEQLARSMEGMNL